LLHPGECGIDVAPGDHIDIVDDDVDGCARDRIASHRVEQKVPRPDVRPTEIRRSRCGAPEGPHAGQEEEIQRPLSQLRQGGHDPIVLAPRRDEQQRDQGWTGIDPVLKVGLGDGRRLRRRFLDQDRRPPEEGQTASFHVIRREGQQGVVASALLAHCPKEVEDLSARDPLRAPGTVQLVFDPCGRQLRIVWLHRAIG
jgi:hypothetical protein